MNTKSFLLLIVVAALLAPHTFEISSQNIPDAFFTRYSVITLLFTLFYEFGSTFAGPYTTLFIMPPTSAILLNGLILIVNLSIILSLWSLIKGQVSRSVILYIIAIALCVHAILVIGLFSYQASAWESVLSIPLPIFPIICALLVLLNKMPILMKPESS